MTHTKPIRLIDRLVIIALGFSVVFFSYTEGLSYISQILTGALVVIFITRLVFSGNTLIITREFILIFSWLAFAALSGLFATDFNLFFNGFMIVTRIFVMAFVLFNLMAWMKDATVTWTGVFFGALVMSYFVYMNPAAYTIQGRLAGTLGNANLYGLALLVALMYSLYVFFSPKTKWLKVLYLASMPFIVYMIGGTGSRKALVSALLLLFAMAVAKFHGNIRKKPIYAVSIMLALCISLAGMFVYFQNSPHFSRLLGTYEAVKDVDVKKADGSFRGRLFLYELAFDVALDNPAVGVGLNNFKLEMARRAPGSGATYSHSNYMEILSSTGLVGFMLYFSIYASIFAKLLKFRKAKLPDEYRELYVVTAVLFLVYVLYDFAMVSYYEKLSWFIFSGILCSVYLIGEKEKEMKLSARASTKRINTRDNHAA